MTKVLLSTNKGEIEIELNAEKAPNTVDNFLQYVNAAFYDGTIFHRVIDNFMIQGGGFTQDMQQKQTQAPIKNEANTGLKNDKGSIAMARTNDPDSATAQFFINLKDNDFLNFTAKTKQGWGYAVFGKITKGIEIVEAIGQVATGSYHGMDDVPEDPIIIDKAVAVPNISTASQ